MDSNFNYGNTGYPSLQGPTSSTSPPSLNTHNKYTKSSERRVVKSSVKKQRRLISKGQNGSQSSNQINNAHPARPKEQLSTESLMAALSPRIKLLPQNSDKQLTNFIADQCSVQTSSLNQDLGSPATNNMEQKIIPFNKSLSYLNSIQHIITDAMPVKLRPNFIANIKCTHKIRFTKDPATKQPLQTVGIAVPSPANHLSTCMRTSTSSLPLRGSKQALILAKQKNQANCEQRLSYIKKLRQQFQTETQSQVGPLSAQGSRIRSPRCAALLSPNPIYSEEGQIFMDIQTIQHQRPATQRTGVYSNKKDQSLSASQDFGRNSDFEGFQKDIAHEQLMQAFNIDSKLPASNINIMMNYKTKEASGFYSYRPSTDNNITNYHKIIDSVATPNQVMPSGDNSFVKMNPAFAVVAQRLQVPRSQTASAIKVSPQSSRVQSSKHQLCRAFKNSDGLERVTSMKSGEQLRKIVPIEQKQMQMDSESHKMQRIGFTGHRAIAISESRKRVKQLFLNFHDKTIIELLKQPEDFDKKKLSTLMMNGEMKEVYQKNEDIVDHFRPEFQLEYASQMFYPQSARQYPSLSMKSQSMRILQRNPNQDTIHNKLNQLNDLVHSNRDLDKKMRIYEVKINSTPALDMFHQSRQSQRGNKKPFDQALYTLSMKQASSNADYQQYREFCGQAGD